MYKWRAILNSITIICHKNMEGKFVTLAHLKTLMYNEYTTLSTQK